MAVIIEKDTKILIKASLERWELSMQRK